MTEDRRYPLHQSRLYKIKSPAQLASILRLTRSDVQSLLSMNDNYIRFNEKKSGRAIQWPKPKMRAVHKRISVLLSRIETPDFLHSAIKGRSYITNADQHSASHQSIKVDIKKFFQSVRAPAVYHFFKDRMLCAPDVAGMLTCLLTVDGHLPTGSSVSPILSYFAYSDMFDEIEKLAKQRDCIMTCYIDDMTFTGTGATGKLMYEARKIIGRFRLTAHKTRLFRNGQVRVVTGIAITQEGMRVPNRRQKLIADDTSAFHSAVSDEERLEIGRRLMSRLFEAASVDEAWLMRAREMQRTCARLKRLVDSQKSIR